MAVVLTDPDASKHKRERAKALRLVRTIKNSSTDQPQPETPVQTKVQMEFSYDDLYMMYDYITKEQKIKNPLG